MTPEPLKSLHLSPKCVNVYRLIALLYVEVTECLDPTHTLSVAESRRRHGPCTCVQSSRCGIGSPHCPVQSFVRASAAVPRGTTASSLSRANSQHQKATLPNSEPLPSPLFNEMNNYLCDLFATGCFDHDLNLSTNRKMQLQMHMFYC